MHTVSNQTNYHLITHTYYQTVYRIHSPKGILGDSIVISVVITSTIKSLQSGTIHCSVLINDAETVQMSQLA